MPRSTPRLVALLLLLLAAAVGGVWVQRQLLASNPLEGGFALVADLNSWRATPRERQVQATFDLRLGSDFAAVPLQLGQWQGEDVPQDNLEVFLLLEPEQYLFRRYSRPDGAYLWLSLVGSRQDRSFHPPQICYQADGWTTEMSSQALPLDRGELWGMHLLGRKDESLHSVLYVYLWPSRERRPEDGAVLFKITAPLADDSPKEQQRALAAQVDFVQQVFLAAAAPGP
ncbi:MAG: exosortase-associated EpsI family protein [Chloroflexi bacterium]|nr:exosortase-associated EpsI family protein [Chloroflexota bacterium]